MFVHLHVDATDVLIYIWHIIQYMVTFHVPQMIYPMLLRYYVIIACHNPFNHILFLLMFAAHK